MVDPDERTRMQKAAFSLLSNAWTWDQFDAYFSQLKTQDEALYDIGEYFWSCFDPEYPSNRSCVSGPVVFRAVLFLSSALQYSAGNRRSACKYWPFLGDDDYSTEFGRHGACVNQLLQSLPGFAAADEPDPRGQ